MVTEGALVTSGQQSTARHRAAARSHLRRHHAVQHRDAAAATPVRQRRTGKGRRRTRPKSASRSRMAALCRSAAGSRCPKRRSIRAPARSLLRAVFPNPRRELLPGMFVRAQLSQGTRSAALLVPQRGVSHNPRGEATVLIVDKDDKVAERRGDRRSRHQGRMADHRRTHGRRSRDRGRTAEGEAGFAREARAGRRRDGPAEGQHRHARRRRQRSRASAKSGQQSCFRDSSSTGPSSRG